MKRKKVNKLTGLISAGLLASLIFRLTTVSGGMILSGLANGDNGHSIKTGYGVI